MDLSDGNADLAILVPFPFRAALLGKELTMPTADAVLSHLKSGGLTGDRLKEFSAVAAQINAAGLKGLRVQTKGIPIPDWIKVSGIGDKAAIGKLLSDILDKTPHIGGVVIFPYGIPFPDLYRVDLDIGPGAPIAHG